MFSLMSISTNPPPPSIPARAQPDTEVFIQGRERQTLTGEARLWVFHTRISTLLELFKNHNSPSHDFCRSRRLLHPPLRLSAGQELINSRLWNVILKRFILFLRMLLQHFHLAAGVRRGSRVVGSFCSRYEPRETVHAREKYLSQDKSRSGIVMLVRESRAYPNRQSGFPACSPL